MPDRTEFEKPGRYLWTINLEYIATTTETPNLPELEKENTNSSKQPLIIPGKYLMPACWMAMTKGEAAALVLLLVAPSSFSLV